MGEARRMLRLVVVVAVLVSSNALAAKTVRVKSFVTRKGTYVAPSRRTSGDASRLNNWSTTGNTNPYTGTKGSKSPYRTK